MHVLLEAVEVVVDDALLEVGMRFPSARRQLRLNLDIDVMLLIGIAIRLRASIRPAAARCHDRMAALGCCGGEGVDLRWLEVRGGGG